MDWNALLSALSLVFVAELGDKTQLAVVTQMCRYRRPWFVFLGASLALTLTTLLGALSGGALSRLIPETILRTAAALAFVAVALVMAREALKASASSVDVQACEQEPQIRCVPAPKANWQAFASTFGLLFVAELGDKTQLSVLSLASKYGSPWAVFMGGALALTLVSGLGVLGGQSLCRAIPERILLWISAALFFAMGLLVLFGVL